MPRRLTMRQFVARQIALVTVLPVAVIVVLIWLVLLPQLRTSIGIQQQSLARTVAGEILAHLMGGERQLVALADMILAEKGLTSAQLTTLLDAGCGEGDLFETIYIVAEAQNTISYIGLARPSRYRRDDLLGIDVSGRDLHKIARREVKTVWSKTFLSTVSGHLAVAVAVPLPGRVIIGEITLDRLSKYISQLPVEAQLLTLVIDRQGRIVADSQQKRMGQQLEPATLPPSGNDASAVLATRPFSLFGMHMVASMVDVDRLGWKVLVAQPHSSAYKSVRAMLVLVAAGLVIALIVSLALGWFMAKRLQGLVAVYTSHAESIAHGKYDLNWPTASTVEHYKLGENLQSMARQIRQREKQLVASETHMRITLDSIGDGVITTDTNGIVTRLNPVAADLTGWPSKEAIGQPLPQVFNIVDSNTRKKVENPVYRVLSTGEIVGLGSHTLLISQDGREYQIADSGAPIRHPDGQIAGVVLVFRDVTERKQAEEAVRHLRNYLSNIINSMPSVLVGVDGEGRVTQWNKQAERVTGLTLAEVHQKPLEMVFTSLAEVIDQIQAAIRDRRVIRKLKVPRQHEDEIHYEDIIIFPLVANGVEGAVIRMDDVTERVRLEELMIQSEKMLSIGGLAAGMAHEINNPLAGILQNADVLKNRLFADLPANRRAADAAGIRMEALQYYLEQRKLPEMVTDIRESGLRATTIVKNMLGFARKSDRTASSHDICALLDQTIELVKTDYDMKKHYDFKKIRIHKEYDAVNLQVLCEAGKIQQVFLNLLKNGAEAMSGIGAKRNPAGAKRPPQFIIRTKADEKWVQVEIEDNGPGLDAKTRRSVFEPFFTTKPVGEGTGLGLSVSYFIITKDHGGEMAVEPAQGGGARFIIRLPKSGKGDANKTAYLTSGR